MYHDVSAGVTVDDSGVGMQSAEKQDAEKPRHLRGQRAGQERAKQGKTGDISSPVIIFVHQELRR